tara:strand:- start:113 stop:343 length:231 start_codon:yes stop_codon:yes gene_type:complete
VGNSQQQATRRALIMVDASIHNVVEIKTLTNEIGEGDDAFLVQKFVFIDKDENEFTVSCFLKRGFKVPVTVITEKD